MLMDLTDATGSARRHRAGVDQAHRRCPPTRLRHGGRPAPLRRLPDLHRRLQTPTPPAGRAMALGASTSRTGEFPDVTRSFVPVGCQHCDEPPCETVCPTTATQEARRRSGHHRLRPVHRLCFYCSVACPYNARYKVTRDTRLWRGKMANEVKRTDPARIVAWATAILLLLRPHRLRPRPRPRARRRSRRHPGLRQRTIASALTFGDIDDPTAKASRLLREN